ncbi:MAG: Inositol 2-dehydrogenase/D-chiro-inositol 3-dehydrogenase [Methanoregula sp. SKADARSKE-2]|nr:MAG: Inositol 2-dehydrogenase/D-chiro-inositol 3-dehydrogenase [Methanoregula sp. SKADARSKE-2]
MIDIPPVRGARNKIIVVGAGSIGQRHAANLARLGADISVSDVNEILLKKVCAENSWAPVLDLDYALNTGVYDAAIICTPNHLHIPYAQKAADAGLHLFVEKPLSHNRQGIDTLLREVRRKNLVGMAGFMLRHEPGLQYIKKTLLPGNVAFVQVESGSHMPSWRPETDYRKTYSANRSMGGGIILDDVHEIDYACWLFGYPSEVRCLYGRFSNFQIDVEDTAEFQFLYPDKLVTIHSDYLQRRYSRRCKICMKDGNTLEWIFGEHVIAYIDDHEEVFVYKDSFAVNDLYLAEMREFLACLEQHRDPESSLENAVKILDIALTAKGE